MIAIVAFGCDQDSATSAKGNEDKSGAAQPADAPKPTEAKPAGEGDMAMGELRAVEGFDLGAFVNRTPEEVEAVLGSPTDTGSDRISCVRFVPERVFFACETEIRAYKHANFEEIRIEFEDGKAARVSVIGVPGSGEFDPLAALASVGISVPGEPHKQTEGLAPVDGSEGGTATIWDWGNSASRLLVDGLQHRVRVSVVDGDWRRSKVEVLINHPLNDDQKARIKPVKGQGGESSEQVSSPE